MAKRVSLKGKGADLFFGEYDPPPIPVEATADGIAIAPSAPGVTTPPTALPAVPMDNVDNASARPAASKQGLRQTTRSEAVRDASHR